MTRRGRKPGRDVSRAAWPWPRGARGHRRALRTPAGIVGFFVLVGVALGVVLTDDRSIAAEDRLQGAARIIDGDTFDVGGERVRLWGVDAPELAQTCQDDGGADYDCGQASRRSLVILVSGRALDCVRKDFDRYGRVVARCSVDGRDLGRAMVREGQALDYTRYSRGAYLADELLARRDRAGVWSGAFVRPEEWRRRP